MKTIKEAVEEKTFLQVRVLRQHRTGTMTDVTHDEGTRGYGLKDLQERSSHAYSGLMRTKELLELLALAAENREQVEGALVRRVLGEIETELSRGGDLGCYVDYTHFLFEEAMALPQISGIKRQNAARLLLHAAS